MNFEAIQGTLEQRGLDAVGGGQCKVSAKLDLQTPMKRMLSVNSAVYVGGIERTDAEVRVTGKVVTRVIYIDELDGFNSEEHADSFNERYILRDHGDIFSVIPAVHVLETIVGETSPTYVDAVTVLNIGLLGVIKKELRYVADVRGGCEAKREKMTVSAFSKGTMEKFETGERFDLDKNCDGILGTDCVAILRDIICNEGKILLKGTVSANVQAIKNTEEGRQIYSTAYDWDFTKSIPCKELGLDDTACGSVVITNLEVKAENRTKPELVIDAELMFCGHAITQTAVEFVTDAICFDNVLHFEQIIIDNTVVHPQSNILADVEGNLTMPEGSPYISKILSVGAASINGVNIIPADNKVTLEGVITTNIVYECDERGIHTHKVQVPFSTVCKIDGTEAKTSIQVSAQPISCNIKARRGKELLVDARLGVGIAASAINQIAIVGNITAGEPKPKDDSAIIIHVAGGNETVWDIAKRVNIASAEIVKQNPIVGTGIPAGEHIVIYKQEVVAF